MKSNPILEEVWRIKDQLAAEAGYDVDQVFDNLRKWSDEHPHKGPVVRNAEELRRLIVDEERKRGQNSALSLKERPSKHGHD